MYQNTFLFLAIQGCEKCPLPMRTLLLRLVIMSSLTELTNKILAKSIYVLVLQIVACETFTLLFRTQVYNITKHNLAGLFILIADSVIKGVGIWIMELIY
jgi:hypothetical protein